MNIPARSDKFTPLQLELLRLFAQDVPEEQLFELKRLIAGYFAGKLSDEMDSILGSDAEVDAWIDSLKTDHNRTAYQPHAGSSFRDRSQ